MSRALLAAARAIVAEFDDAEAGRGSAFPVHYEDRNGKVLENRAMVRIRLLNRLRAAVRAEKVTRDVNGLTLGDLMKAENAGKVRVRLGGEMMRRRDEARKAETP